MAAPFDIHVLATPLPGGCHALRIAEPYGMLARRYDLRLFVHWPNADQKYGLPRNRRPNGIYVFHRRRFKREGVTILRHLRREGHLLIHEVDDHPNLFPDHAAERYIAHRGVHALSLSTDPLADFFRPINPTVAVFPNQIANLQPLSARADGPLRIFWAALNRLGEARALAPVLTSILAARPGVEIVIVQEKQFFDALAVPNKRFLPLLNYADYKRLLPMMDIMLMPLDDDVTNRAKSDLKFIEAAAAGAVALASPTVYARTLRDGETGLLFRTAEEFRSQLTRLIDDASWREGLRRAAWDYVARERRLEDHMAQRWAWLNDLYARRDALDAALLEREPDLA